MDQEIKDTLSNIIYYIGADPKYIEYAQLITFLEWLVAKAKQEPGEQ